MKPFLVAILLLATAWSYGQQRDTIISGNWQVINPIQHKFWGNSTYLSQGVNFARNKEFELGLGRTKGLNVIAGQGFFFMTMRSWGINYALTDVAHKTMRQSIKGFWEFGFVPTFFIGDFLLRGEYIYQLSDGQHYLRPSVGLTFVFVDIVYNYSFLLNQSRHDNLYRHGISVRLKQFIGMKNWERKRYIGTSRFRNNN
jgi:hypothetical protein